MTASCREAARIQPGQRVLDVPCGTGILARTIAEQVTSARSVVGIDIADGMLTVAERKAPNIEWRQGPAPSSTRKACTANPFDCVRL